MESFDNKLFCAEIQLELVRYIDTRLEQIELLLYKLDRLARLAVRDAAQEAERKQLQTEVVRLQQEIDRIASQLNVSPD